MEFKGDNNMERKFFFLVTKGIAIPYLRTFSFGKPMGIIKAHSKNGAAKKLGIRRWEGWKKINPIDIRSERFEKSWYKFFFFPTDIELVEKNFAEYESIERSTRVFILEEIPELIGKHKP